VSVDGLVFVLGSGGGENASSFIQLAGIAECGLPIINEWDFVRFGTISDGEEIVGTNPIVGVLDARRDLGIDRFTVTFDAPNYVYVGEIAVEVTDSLSGLAAPNNLVPVVINTWRREPPDPFDVEDDPRIVEIVLDRPLPFNATTRFTLSDEVNRVEYSFAPADANGTGTTDLSDVAYFQNCFGSSETAGLCGVFDLDRNGTVNHLDLADLLALMQGQ